MARLQREVERLRAMLWSNGIDPCTVRRNAAVANNAHKAVRQHKQNAQKRQSLQQCRQRLLAPPMQFKACNGDGDKGHSFLPPGFHHDQFDDNQRKLAAGLFGSGVVTAHSDLLPK